MLMYAPDLISYGRQTVTVSHRKTTAETTIFTFASCPLLFGALVIATSPFPLPSFVSDITPLA